MKWHVIGLSILAINFGCTKKTQFNSKAGGVIEPSGSDEAPILEISSGNNQSSMVGQALTAPIQIRVIDPSGSGVAGVTLNWVVSSGAGALSGCSSATDADGHSSCLWTLGTTAGVNTVEVSMASSGSQSVSFSATGTHGTADSIRVSQWPTTDLVGEPFKTNPTIEVIDQYGNVVTSGSDASANISVTVSSGTGSIDLNNISCQSDPAHCTVTAVNGAVILNLMRLTHEGAKSIAFTKASTSGSGGVGALSVIKTIEVLGCNLGGPQTCPGCWSYTTAGAHSWTVPSNWNSSTTRRVELIGGGGAGGSIDAYDFGGGGGGGGGFASAESLNLTENSVLALTVGAGGQPSTTVGGFGGSSYFISSGFLNASGGSGGGLPSGGQGGTGSGSALTFMANGGTGSVGTNDECGGGCVGGGGGGGAAAKSGNGSSGSDLNAGSGGGRNSSLSFISGGGGTGAPLWNWGEAPSPGVNWGGGGGGASSGMTSGEVGASGAGYISCK